MYFSPLELQVLLRQYSGHKHIVKGKKNNTAATARIRFECSLNLIFCLITLILQAETVGLLLNLKFVFI